MPEIAESKATPDDGSLNAATTAIVGLLSDIEDPKADEKHPEPSKTVSAESSAKQVPAEPEAKVEETPAEVIEQETSDESENPETPPTQPRKLKINDEIGEVTEEEAIKGYLRHADYTRKTQAVADEKRQFEEKEATAVRAQRSQYDQLLGQLETALTELQPAEPDWEKRKNEVPSDQLTAELLSWQQSQKRVEQVRSERAKVKAQQEEDAARGFKQYVELEHAKLLDALPDMKEPEKAKVLRGQLVEHAKSYGFSEDELGKVVDHRVVRVLHDAMQFRKAKAKAPEIKNKIEKVLETSAPGSRTTAPKADKLKEAQQRLKKSGSVQDGALAIAALLDAEEAAPTRR